MAGGYEDLAKDPIEELRRQLAETRRRLDELERPIGTQVDQSRNVVPYGSIGISATAFSLTTSFAGVANADITVPPGYQNATIMAVANFTARNTTDAVDFLRGRVSIGTANGGAALTRIGINEYGHVSANAIQTMSVIGVSTINVEALVRTDTVAWASSPSNAVNLDAIAVFGRTRID